MVDWWLQERSLCSTNSDRMLYVSTILLWRPGRVVFWRGWLKFVFSKFVVQVYRLLTRCMQVQAWWVFGLHRCYFCNDRLQKTSWRIRSSLSKVLCNRAIPQKSAKDGYKHDETAVDTRFRHWNTGSKRPPGNNGGVVRGHEIPTVVLREYREDLQNESKSSEPLGIDICHKICSHVSVHPSEGVTPHDLSIFDGGHDSYSEVKGWIHWSENVQDCWKVWIWFSRC